MSEAKHTPGPWRTFDGNPAKIEILCGDRLAPAQKPSAGVRVAEVRARRVGKGGAFKPNEADRANARLIAAAPDLLRALQGLARVHRQQDTCGVMPADKAIAYGIADAAIVKATGLASGTAEAAHGTAVGTRTESQP